MKLKSPSLKFNLLIADFEVVFSEEDHFFSMSCATNVPVKQIEGSIRISMGSHTTSEDIQGFKDKFKLVYEEVRDLLV